VTASARAGVGAVVAAPVTEVTVGECGGRWRGGTRGEPGEGDVSGEGGGAEGGAASPARATRVGRAKEKAQV